MVLYDTEVDMARGRWRYGAAVVAVLGLVTAMAVPAGAATSPTVPAIKGAVAPTSRSSDRITAAKTNVALDPANNGCSTDANTGLVTCTYAFDPSNPAEYDAPIPAGVDSATVTLNGAAGGSSGGATGGAGASITVTVNTEFVRTLAVFPGEEGSVRAVATTYYGDLGEGAFGYAGSNLDLSPIGC
jgi:hypothetical protein